jgi:hypothetical protein
MYTVYDRILGDFSARNTVHRIPTVMANPRNYVCLQLGVALIRQCTLLSSQSGSSKGVSRVLQTLMAIVRAEGMRGLYAGLGPNILQV